MKNLEARVIGGACDLCGPAVIVQQAFASSFVTRCHGFGVFHALHVCICLGVSQGVPPHTSTSPTTCLIWQSPQFCDYTHVTAYSHEGRTDPAGPWDVETICSSVADGVTLPKAVTLDTSMEDKPEQQSQGRRGERPLPPAEHHWKMAEQMSPSRYEETEDDVALMQRGKSKRTRSPSPRRRRRHQQARDRGTREEQTRQQERNRGTQTEAEND